MKTIQSLHQQRDLPVTILQYGEGNFLRGFVDYMVDIANETTGLGAGIVLVKPIPFGSLEALEEQNHLYTVILRGKMDGAVKVEKRVVRSVVGSADTYTQFDRYMALAEEETLRFIVSNTTEAGIVYDPTDTLEAQPAKTYPGKLTQLLYRRYQAFSGAADKGLILLPVELIEHNGTTLRDCVLKLADLWKLPADFVEWVKAHNIFCNTLVDRIITGYPKEEAETLETELGYQDKLIVTGEPFALWVIESDKAEQVQKELPLDAAGLPVIFTQNLQPYRERKVRILNGAHTATVLAAYLDGKDIVSECLSDPTVRAYMEKAVYGEIAPTVHLPAGEVKQFADSVLERFENPFIRHNLLSIALNSVSKWKARVLPSLKDSLANTGELPNCLSFSLAALMAFYSTGNRTAEGLLGSRNGQEYLIQDDAPVLDFFAANHSLPASELADKFLSQTAFWGENLTDISGLSQKVAGYLEQIRKDGIHAAIQSATA